MLIVCITPDYLPEKNNFVERWFLSRTSQNVLRHFTLSKQSNRVIHFIRKYCRNLAIDRRIERLSPHTTFPGHWSAMTAADREQMVRKIAATRHAIERLRRMKA